MASSAALVFLLVLVVSAVGQPMLADAGGGNPTAGADGGGNFSTGQACVLEKDEFAIFDLPDCSTTCKSCLTDAASSCITAELPIIRPLPLITCIIKRVIDDDCFGKK